MDVTLGLVGGAVVVVMAIQLVVIVVIRHFQEWAVVIAIALNQNVRIPREEAQRRSRHPHRQVQRYRI